MNVAIYLRVSTISQSTEMQLSELKAVVQKSGWNVIGIYEDAGVSGASEAIRRPGLSRLLRDANLRKFDMVVIWSMDRLARSMAELVKIMLDLDHKRIHLFSYRQAVDSSTPSGRMMWQLLGVFAEFERAMIQERVRAGIENARSKGIKLGRPRLSRSKEEEVLKLRATGLGLVKIGRMLGIGTSQVQRICEGSAPL